MQFNNSDDLSGHLSFHKKWLQDRQSTTNNNNYKSQSKNSSPRERNSVTQATGETPRRSWKNTTFISRDQDEESFEALRPLNETIMTRDLVPILQLETEEMDQSTYYQYKSYYEENAKEPPRWETLYQLDKKIRQHKDQLEKEAYEREVDSECTFQPKLNTPFNFQRYEYALPLHERNKIWKHDREERLAIIRDEKEIRKMKECTFQPNLVNFSGEKRFILTKTHHKTTSATIQDPSSYQFQGIHNYLNRQLNARKHKEEIDHMYETSFSKSPGGSRRDSSVTTPRVPNLQTEIRAVEYGKRKEKSPKSGTSRPRSPHRSINLAHTNALAAGHAAYRLYDAIETGSEFGREKDKGFAKAVESLHNELHRFELNY